MSGLERERRMHEVAADLRRPQLHVAMRYVCGCGSTYTDKHDDGSGNPVRCCDCQDRRDGGLMGPVMRRA